MTQDAKRQNFKIRRGDDWGDEATIEFSDGAGDPLDITGMEIWMTFRASIVRSATATDSSVPPDVQITSPAVVGGPGGISVLDGPAGTAQPALTPTQTKALVARRYAYDVQIRVAGKIKTTQWGTVEMLDEVTLGA